MVYQNISNVHLLYSPIYFFIHNSITKYYWQHFAKPLVKTFRKTCNVFLSCVYSAQIWSAAEKQFHCGFMPTISNPSICLSVSIRTDCSDRFSRPVYAISACNSASWVNLNVISNTMRARYSTGSCFDEWSRFVFLMPVDRAEERGGERSRGEAACCTKQEKRRPFVAPRAAGLTLSLCDYCFY